MSAEFPKMALKDVQALFRGANFQNGMTYYDNKSVLHPSRFENKIFAQVQGSGASQYNVTLTFEEKVTPKCTCPAARRDAFCKHVAAVLVGWARNSDAFVVVADAPELTTATAKKASVKKGKTETQDLLARGLEALETLTTEFVLGGLASITLSRVEQVRDLAENLRAYKLRRLATALTEFAAMLQGLLTQPDQFSLPAYANLLADIVVTAKGVAAIQQGKLQDPKYLEELVGKTWRDAELPPRNDLELIELFFEVKQTIDEFKVFASYFVELRSGDLLTEKLILPKQLQKKPDAEKRSYHGRKLGISDALQYPGYAPFRLKFKTMTEQDVRPPDIDAMIARANPDFANAVAAFQAFKKDVFAPDDYYALLRPTGFYAASEGLAIFDAQGQALPLRLPENRAWKLESLLASAPIKALFGKIQAQQGRFVFTPLSAVSVSVDAPVSALI